jgi:hypothetical protein
MRTSDEEFRSWHSLARGLLRSKGTLSPSYSEMVESTVWPICCKGSMELSLLRWRLLAALCDVDSFFILIGWYYAAADAPTDAATAKRSRWSVLLCGHVLTLRTTSTNKHVLHI